jgi:hypothetical protein
MLKYLPVIAAFLLLLSSTHVMALEERTLSINGTKFDDSNKNAIYDEGEHGLSGWVIRLKLDDREISNTTTNESGFYSFANLVRGNYTVTEDQQAGWVQSAPVSRGYIINLSDKSVNRVDFGNFRSSNTSTAPARLSGVAVRPSRAFDEGYEGSDIRTYIDENGNVQYITTMRVTPERIAKMYGEDYKKAPSAIRPRRDADSYSQGFSPERSYGSAPASA